MTNYDKALLIKDYIDYLGDICEIGEIDLLNAIHEALDQLSDIERIQAVMQEDDGHDEEEEIELTADASAVEDEFNDIAVYQDTPSGVVRVHVPYTGRVVDKVFDPGGCK